MGKWQRRLWKWAAGAFAALVILLATVVGLFRLLTPLVPAYRLQVEQWASTELQHPVQIHSMGADWSWNGPEVTLQDTRILSRDRQREVVAAGEVRLGLDWRSLLHFKLPRPSRVVLVAPRLEVQRLADGSYAIRGLGTTAQTGNTDWRATLTEVLAQTAEVVVKDGQLTLFDPRHPGTAVFTRIGLRIDNLPDDHRIQGEASLPAALGRKLDFQSRIRGEGIDPAHWDWHAELQGSGLQPAQISAYLPQPLGYLGAGVINLDVRANAEHGVMQTATANFDAHDLVPAAPLGSAPAVPLLQGKFEWSRAPDGWRVLGRDVALQVEHSAPWTPQDVDLEYAQDGDGDHWSGDAGLLRMQDLAALTDWLPQEQAAVVKRAHAFAPSGDVSGLDFKLGLDGKKPKDWAVKAVFQKLGLRAAEGYPGFAGMSGRVDLADRGGEVQLDAQDADVDFRPLFRTLLHADSAKLIARVDHDKTGWRVATDSFLVANADAAAHGRAGMQFPSDGSAPVLDLDATVDRADARNKSTYFPVGIMPTPVVEWLDTSIKSGQVTSGTVSIHGKTSDFPWRDNHGGTFDIQFHLQHARLDYFQGWPAIKDLNADVRFLDQGLEAHAHSGTIQNLEIQDGTTARFVELASGILQVDGDARGSAGNGLDFLRQGPLRKLLGGYLDGFTARGSAIADIHFTLPVTHPQDFVLKGRATLQEVSLWPTSLPELVAERLHGSIDFGNYGLSTDGVEGTLLGGPVAVVIHTPNDAHGGLSAVSVRGTAQATGIATVLGHGTEHWLEGQSDWRLDGRIPMQPGTSTAGLDLTLQSDLQGLGMKLPAPFGKQAAESQALRVALKLETVDDLSLTGNYGTALGLRLDLAPHKGGLGFDRGELRLGGAAAARPARSGFTVDGHLAEFDWDQWKQALLPMAGNDSQPGNTPVQRGALPPVLADVDISVGHLAGFGQSLDKVQLSLKHGDDGWQGRLDSVPVAGSVKLPASVDAEHPIVLDMDRVLLVDKPVAAVAPAPAQAKLAPANFDPRSVPALRFSAKQFQFGRMTLDNISLSLVPLPAGIALEDVKVADPSFSVSGDGTWVVTPAGQQHTMLNADVESKDVEKSLQSLGFDAGLSGEKGSIVASLNWQDSPMGDVVHSLGGTIHLKLQNGQIKEIQPGAGRLFGLLSINALPRRVLLNFSDVFGKGFGYDSIEGDFLLQQGDAYTKNLTVNGPAAGIHLVGRTGLAKHDFDQALIVDPSVSSSLPIVGALAAGVGVGAVVFLLTEIFKKPLTEAGEARYHLTGTWDNPVLTKVPSSSPPASARKP
ncbi:MAG TPA: YhdP family protein [Gammaproteobacteria bacterium]|nr:YhdP family protein [Gammaproteobacteria bacterium]